jgi:hypothetical protein
MTITTDDHCDCARHSELRARRLNTLCLCPQRPTPLDPHLQIAAVPVFVASSDLASMAALIRAIDAVVRSNAWRDRVLAHAPTIARRDPGNAGVLFGYDFHLLDESRLPDEDRHDAQPQLIEINTNAGGAFIVAQVLQEQSGCCASASKQPPACQAQTAETHLIDSLLDDFGMVRGHREPGLIAIVDDHPEDQYLYPEFLRCAELLRARGLRVAICDASQLHWSGTELQWRGDKIDLVYNRLTDFYLAAEHLRPLREAYTHDAIVLTPNPHHHALYADKRHLALLSDAQVLQELGVPEATREILLAAIPATRRVDAAHAEQLWRERKQFFFKPASAYGGKGAYRGAKLTRSTFEQLLQADYVAQREVEPPLRRARIDGATTELKIDVRCYVYRGAIQLTAARLWRGQTTNFRTPGGGFATISATAN